MPRNARVAMAKSINRICNSLLSARYPRLVRSVRSSMQRLPGFRGHVSACLEHAQHCTSAEREPLSPSSYRACLAKAWLSRARFLSSLVDAFALYRPRYEGKLFVPAIQSPTLDQCGAAATCTRGNRTKEAVPRILLWFFKGGTVVLSSRAQLRDKRFRSLG